VVKRLSKERTLYAKENQDQKLKVDGLVASNGDEWDIKNGKRMLEESEKMILDTNKRLGAAVQDLRELIVQSKDDPELAGTQEFLDAQGEMEVASV